MPLRDSTRPCFVLGVRGLSRQGGCGDSSLGWRRPPLSNDKRPETSNLAAKALLISLQHVWAASRPPSR